MSTILQKVVPVAALLSLSTQLAMPAFAQNYDGDASSGTPRYSSDRGPYEGNSNVGYAGYTNGGQPQNYRQGRVSFAPAGLTFPVSLSTSISTDVARPGDKIEARLNDNINLGDSVIPAGSTVVGRITDSKSGGFMGKSGLLTIKFTALRLPNGMEAPMSAHIVGGIGNYKQVGSQSDTFRGEGMTAKVGQGALRTAIGAGTGAALGTAIGAIAGRGHYGSVGRGAWSGAAIGGGLGLADSVFLRKGRNVKINSGSQMQLQLDTPMSVAGGVASGAF